MKYLPINVKIKNEIVLVLGGGNVAKRKIMALLKMNVQVVCIATEFKQDIKKMAAQKIIECIRHDLNDLNGLNILKPFESVKLIYSATANKSINQMAYSYAQQNNIFINTVDEPDLCTFITPAIIDRSPVIITVNSEGSAPILTRIIKQKISHLLPANLGHIADKAKKMRSHIKKMIPKMNSRRTFWENYFQWSHKSQTVIPQDFKNYSTIQINDLISIANNKKGLVSLVGAGPGNPDLLTLKAIKVLQTADVVLHDNLVSDEIIQMVRADADLINVGKQAGNHKTNQHSINQKLIDLAKQDLHVCRLKGGDSFVFGRGGEEIMALKNNHIPYEIIPGITAAVGCAAYAGIPLTHREHTQSLSFMTAHCSHSIDTIDWKFYAKDKQTLAVYMGLIKAERLQEQLLLHGKSPEEYVAIIENGTLPSQRTVVGNLNQLPVMIKEHNIKSPALIIIGEVAQYASQLDWFKKHIDHQQLFTYSKTA